MSKNELANFLDSDAEFETLSNMDAYGGSFVKALATMYRMADRFNKVKTLATFGEYFTHYKNFNKKV